MSRSMRSRCWPRADEDDEAEQGEKEDGEGQLAQVTLVTPQTQRRTGGQNV